MNARIFLVVLLLFSGAPELRAQEKETSSESAAKKKQYTELFVYADPLEPSLLESGHAVSVLDRDEIIKRGETTLGDTVDLEPGVRSSNFGPGASRPTIRGFSGDRVRIMKNGLGTGDVSNLSEDHAVSVDPLAVETIEVLRGPETLLYGSSAIGGSVNVIDGSIPDKVLEKDIEAELLLQGGDAASDERTAAARIRGKQDRLQWVVSGFHRETDNIEIPGFAESSAFREREEQESGDDDHDEHGGEEEEARGTLPNSDTRTSGFSIGSSYVGDSGYVGIAVSGQFSEYGIPGGHGHEHEEDHEHDDDELHHHSELLHNSRSLDMEESESGPRIDLEQYRVDLSGKIEDVASDIESIKLKAATTFYEHDEIEGGGEVSSAFEQDSFELRSDLVHTFIPEGRGVFGSQIVFEDFSALGEESFIQPVESFAPALFAFQDIGLTDSVNLHLGSRIEYVSRSPQLGSTEEFTPFGFSIGTEWDPTGSLDYLLALHFAYTQRAPAASELFAGGAHLARGIYEFGDSSLGKESSWGFDLTFKKNYGLITGAITPFWQSFQDYINLRGTGEEIEELPVFQYEQVDATFYGFEAETSIHFDELFRSRARDIALDIQVDYVRAQEDDSNDNIPRIPPLRTITRLRYDRDSWAAFVEGVFVSKQTDEAPFELETDAYQVLNAHLEFNAPFENDSNLKFYVRGTNLTDDEARVHSSFLKDQAPLRGRAFLVGVRATL